MTDQAPPAVLCIGGLDPSGGSGIVADVRALLALSVFPLAAVTAVTVQDTRRVISSHAVDAFEVEAQVEAVLSDVSVSCVKIGMLASSATVELLARLLESKARGIPLVLDPVLCSSSGHALLEVKGHEPLLRRLMPLCSLVTPNAEEAELLTGVSVRDERGMHAAADRLLLAGQSAVLIKGGHIAGGDWVVDLLRTADGLERRFESRRASVSVRGTGCTLAAAIAAGLAEGWTLESAVERAHGFVREGIERAVPLGKGGRCFAPAVAG